MCSCDDAERPNFIRQEWRTTKKPHRCVECHRTQPSGSRMQYTSGHWSGGIGFDHFYTCSLCTHMRDGFTEIECHPPFGEMIETVRECLRGDTELIRAWRDAVRKARGRKRSVAA